MSLEELAIEEARILTWLPKVVIFGLREAASSERVAGLLPEDFSDAASTLDELCDGKLLCCFAFSAEPSLAKGSIGFKVEERLAFFQAFCRNLGIPDVNIFSPTDLWPKPAKNPKALFACLGVVAAALAERPGCEAPNLDDVQLSTEATAAAVAKAIAKPKDEAAEAMAAQLAAMAPRKQCENAFDECRRLRAEGAGGNTVLSLVNAREEVSRCVSLAKSYDEHPDDSDGEGKGEEEGRLDGSNGEDKGKEEAPVAAGEGHGESKETALPAAALSSFAYIPPEDAPDFHTDALPVLQGHLKKRSTGQKRWAIANALRLGGWDQRFFILRDMHLLWWEKKKHAASPDASRADGGAKCRGVINFVDAPVQLEVLKANEFQFLLCPGEGNPANRVYEYDASESEHNRAQWMESLHAHLAHAARVRAQCPDQDAKGGNISYSMPSC